MEKIAYHTPTKQSMIDRAKKWKEEGTEVYDGLIARVIQHEYDHIEGILFTDHLSMLKKKLIGKKLQNIMDGKARPDYKMKYVNKKGR